MKIKLITLTALTALSLGSVALAQDQDTDGHSRHRGRGGRHHDMMEKMTESLNLTSDQKTKIDPILQEAKPKLEQIHRDAMEKSKAVMDEMKAKIRPLLTPEQQKKMDEMKNDRRANRKARHGGGSDEGDNG